MNDRVKKALEIDREFAEALINVNRSYDDFVTGIFFSRKKYPDLKEKILEFISEHKEATSSDVSLFYSVTFRGFKRKSKYSFEK